MSDLDSSEGDFDDLLQTVDLPAPTIEMPPPQSADCASPSRANCRNPVHFERVEGGGNDLRQAVLLPKQRLRNAQDNPIARVFIGRLSTNVKVKKC